jgi:hypothetical protein
MPTVYNMENIRLLREVAHEQRETRIDDILHWVFVAWRLMFFAAIVIVLLHIAAK